MWREMQRTFWEHLLQMTLGSSALLCIAPSEHNLAENLV